MNDSLPSQSEGGAIDSLAAPCGSGGGRPGYHFDCDRSFVGRLMALSARGLLLRWGSCLPQVRRCSAARGLFETGGLLQYGTCKCGFWTWPASGRLQDRALRNRTEAGDGDDAKNRGTPCDRRESGIASRKCRMALCPDVGGTHCGGRPGVDLLHPFHELPAPEAAVGKDEGL